MKSSIIYIPVLILFFFKGFAQDNQTILTIGDYKISKAEFERIYRKNNLNLQNESDKKSPQQYMRLFIDFKLKVIEAQTLKMDTFSTFINELKGYRNDLAVPYLTDIQYSGQQILDMYGRMTREAHASHILLRLPEDAGSDVADSVFSRLQMIKKEIESAKSFHEAARDYSEDPSAKMNGGNLGYFSAFQMVTPFEDAVYNATPGKVTGPVRTNFGWHLILVQDIRQNRGELKVAHIMKMFPRDGRGYDKGIYKSQIDSIYKLIQNGADFAKLARDLSDDKQSAVEGGEMPWFSAGRMIPEFAEPAFRLQNNGDFSEPVESPYGYHIIKRIDHRPVKSFEELKPEIEEMIKRDPTRSVSSKKSFIEKLKKEYKFICNTENINALAKDSVNGKFLNSASTLFSMDGKNFTRAQLNDFLATKGIISGKYPLGIDDWIEHEITNHEDSKLESKYPEFGFTVREYHDGILLFNISQEKIWDFAVKDSAGLEKYYTKNKGKYMWGERFKGMVVNCRDSAVYQQACGYFDSGMSVSEVKLLLNKENDEKVNIIEGAWEKGANQAVDYFIWNMPKTDAFDERTTFVRGDLVKPARKNLEEARGYYISDYQNYLEKQWIKELRKKYKIKVNKVLLDEVKSVE